MNLLLYLPPLLIAVGLVYGATRHERLLPILVQSWKAVVWMGGFMAVIFAVVSWLSWLT